LWPSPPLVIPAVAAAVFVRARACQASKLVRAPPASAK
jgi:hypothetical protein